MTTLSLAQTLPRTPRVVGAAQQGTLPSHYALGVRVLSMLAFAYVAFAYVNGRFLHLFENADGEAPIWLSQWTEYAVIIVFGLWRTWAERNPYTRKRLAFLTFAVAVIWWFLPDVLRLPEPHVGALPGQPIFPQIHAPGTLTFFAVLLGVLLFGRRIVCGWNCPCVAIRETVGFSFRDKTLRGERAWFWRRSKWAFFALYMVAFVLIMFSGTAYVSPFYGGFLSLVGFTYFGSFFIAPLTGNRFYCRYMCPYGATFGLLNHVGFFGIRMDTDACVDCRRCEQVCDMGIPVWEQGKSHGRVTGLEDCMGCGRCVTTCPTDALEFRDVRNEFRPKLRMDGSHLLKRDGPPQIADRCDSPSRPAPERAQDWAEERAPLTLDTAIAQARRCLDCGVPGCQNACPLSNRIPEWLEALGEGDVTRAAAISNTTSNMPEICGTVCPSHRLCEGGCTLNAVNGPVTIGALEKFANEEAARQGRKPEAPTPTANGRTVAIIGAGPAGLACADELNKAGFAVTVYDKRPRIGGLLSYGVPSFKLDRAVIEQRRVAYEAAGIAFELGQEIDGDRLGGLIKGNDLLFLGTGAQTARPSHLPGAVLGGVIDGITYLSRLNASQLGDGDTAPDVSGRRVLVLGGGDTALDSARSAIRDGAAEVTIAYRKGPGDMRAAPKDIELATEEGVGFAHHMVPEAFTGGTEVQAVRFADGTQLDCDLAIIAFGQGASDTGWLDGLGIATDAQGYIVTDADGRTSNAKVYAGGDTSDGPSLVVTAVAAGRRAGQAMARTVILH